LFTNNISVSGISSGADFAVQYAVGFSASVTGVGVFAGEPFGCGILKFPKDPEQLCSEQPKSRQGPGCVAAKGVKPATCDGCAPNHTLIYDHCKNNALYITNGRMLDYVLQASMQGHIDHASNLKRMRVYLYHGIADTVYQKETVAAVGTFFKNFVDSSQILEEYNISSTHAWPTNDFGTPCGVSGPTGLENCHYDGSGIMFSKLSQYPLQPPSTTPLGALYSFNQTLYFDPKRYAGIAETGYVYIPDDCLKPHTNCSLHVMFHGCGMYATKPSIGLNFTLYNGINCWADTNRLVILYPQNGGYTNFTEEAPTPQELSGCWDSYGQTGWDYTFKSGPQPSTVQAIINALAKCNK